MKEIIFKRIKYENFKNCTESVDFDLANNGLYLIVGPNGKGKSTKFDAIPACLFRKILSKDDTLKLTDLINENINKDLYLELDLDVKYDDKLVEYKIITTHNHKLEKSRIYINGSEHVFNTVNDQVKYVEENIISFNVFYSIVMFIQQSNDTFLSKTDAQQKQILDSLLDFSYFDNLRENVVRKLNDYKNSKEKLNMEILSIKNQLEKYNELINENKTKLDEKIKSIQNNIYNNNVKLEELKSKYQEKDYTNINNKLLELEKEKHKKEILFNNKLNDKKIEIEKIHAKIKTIDLKLEKDIEKLKADFNLQVENLKEKYRNQFEEYRKEKELEKNNVLNEIQNIEKKKEEESKNIRNKFDEIIISKDEEISKLKDSLSQKENDIRKKIEEHIQIYIDKKLKISNEIYSIQNEIKNFNKLINLESQTCPTCMQNIDTNYIQNIKDQILKNNEKLSALKDELIRIENTVESLKIELEEKVTLVRNECQENIIKIEKEKNIIKESYNTDLEELNLKYNTERYYNMLKKLDEDIKSKYKLLKEQMEENINLLTINLMEKENLLKDEIQKDRDNLYKTLENEKLNYRQIEEEKNIALKIINDKISALKDELTIANELKLKIEELQNINSKLISEIKTNEDNYHSLVNDIRSKQQELKDQIKESDSKIEEYDKQIKILEFWEIGLSSKGIKSYLINSISPFINEELQKIMDELYNNRFEVKLDIKESGSGFKINPVVINKLTGSSGYKKQSGGEKRLIDYSMIMVLNKIYKFISGTKVNILLMDEFFDALDEDNTNLVLQMLKSISLNQAIYIISHNEHWKNNPMFDLIDVY